MALRVPLWCKNFKANVDGKILQGSPGTYLNIDETWHPHSLIKVSFDLPTQTFDGGINYPGMIAIKKGAQVLAIDKALNPLIKNVDSITFCNARLQSLSARLLPEGWIGSGLFKATANYEGSPVDVLLVPFADAGQTGGEVRVWIKKNVNYGK